MIAPIRFQFRSPRRWRVALALLVAVMPVGLGPSSLRPTAAALDDEVRALWVTRASITTPDAIASLVRSARAGGFNTLLVQVRGRGDAYYPSTLEPRAHALAGAPADFDPLQTILTLAHAERLRVHAWINVNLVSSSVELPRSRAHVVYRHPDWLMVPRALAVELARVDVRSPQYVGRLARWTRAEPAVEGLFASPLHPAAADHVVRVVEDLAERYPLDGVHLDYLRYPGPAFDYSRSALAAFYRDMAPTLADAARARIDPRSVNDLAALADRNAERWAGFRRSRLNALVIRLRTAIKQQRPAALLSAAVFPDSAEAAAHRFQDWGIWLENGLIDVVCPMAYTPDAAVFDAQIASARQLAGAQPVWAGIGAYRLSSAQTVRNIQSARRLGARGVVLFSYDSLVRPPRGADYLARVGRAAFAP